MIVSGLMFSSAMVPGPTTPWRLTEGSTLTQTTPVVLTWDNGPETPQEGLLRARVGNRVGYFDLTFRQVVPGTFDFAWPFQDGVAEVCNGCRRGTPDGDGHTPMEGGEWFHIDRQGRRVADPAGR